MYDPIRANYKYTDGKGIKHIISLTHAENMLLYCLYINKGKNVSYKDISVFMYGQMLTKQTYTKITSTKAQLLKKLKGFIKIITYSGDGYLLVELGEKTK